MTSEIRHRVGYRDSIITRDEQQQQQQRQQQQQQVATAVTCNYDSCQPNNISDVRHGVTSDRSTTPAGPYPAQRSIIIVLDDDDDEDLYCAIYR